jgi:phosphatidylglycerophosphate synthase
VSPSAVTIGGAVLVLASCVFLLLTRRVAVFCVLVGLSALSDAIDGALARHTGRASRFGAYLDAMCDRYVEAVVVLTVAAVTGYWLLSMLMIVGALLVSYAKARAAMEVPVDNREWPDLMERTERFVVFLVGLLLGQALGVTLLGRDLFWWTLLGLSTLIHLTVVQRILRARRFILTRA